VWFGRGSTCFADPINLTCEREGGGEKYDKLWRANPRSSKRNRKGET